MWYTRSDPRLTPIFLEHREQKRHCYPLIVDLLERRHSNEVKILVVRGLGCQDDSVNSDFSSTTATTNQIESATFPMAIHTMTRSSTSLVVSATFMASSKRCFLTGFALPE